MGGGSGKTRNGRENELVATGGGNDNIAVPASIGTLGRDQQKKQPKDF